jgi:hypothetical protein
VPCLDFVKGHVFDSADFVIRSDGVCRLNPEMARMVQRNIELCLPAARASPFDWNFDPAAK